MSLRIGVDIGGTFTDLVLLDLATGRLTNAKVLTTPDDPSRGVLAGLAEVLARAGARAADVSQVIHGTTLVANAIIERKGVRVALVATAGFRDVLDMAREWRWDIYDLTLQLPAPLVPRSRAVEVIERLGPDGAVVTPFDDASAHAAATAIAGMDVEAAAICLLHSFRNPDHERRMAAILAEHCPGLAISLSCEISPTIGEYERASTTAANAYVQPVFRRYIAGLAEGMRGMGIGVDLLLMQSDGGTAHQNTALRMPIRLVQSGPAGGARAAALAGQLAGHADVLAFDMGGTTAKACLIPAGQPVRAPDFEVARIARFRRGSGLPLKVPAVDMIEIGAGGGSIARVNALGLIQVGPDSSSADPGPVCYGRGGTEPTVTDADLLLGYLDADNFLGGAMRLDRMAAEAALARFGARLGLTAVQAALGIHDTVNETMAQAAGIHTLEKGLRAQDFAIVAIGGAGPVHACAVAQRLGIGTVICPAGAGVASAFGFLAAPVSFEAARARVEPLATLDPAEVAAILAPLRAETLASIAEAGIDPATCTVEASAELRYSGQGHEVEAAIPADGATAGLRSAFEAAYLALYNRIEPGAAVEAVTWRVIARAPTPDLRLAGRSFAGGSVPPGSRPIWCATARAIVPAPVYDRYRLGPAERIAGPAIVEERESTAVIPHGATARTDAAGNLVITLEPAA